METPRLFQNLDLWRLHPCWILQNAVEVLAAPCWVDLGSMLESKLVVPNKPAIAEGLSWFQSISEVPLTSH